MSILYSNETGWIICHKQFLQNMYKNIENENQIFDLKLDDALFNVNSKFIRINQRDGLNKNTALSNSKKRKRKNDYTLPNIKEIKRVKELYIKILNDAKKNSLFSNSIKCDFNEAAQQLSHHLFDDISEQNLKNCIGSNLCDFSQIVKIKNKEFVFPDNSTFYCYDINDTKRILQINDKFDFILMDPPWWNKSVRRKKAKHFNDSYSMIYNEDLIKIPIKQLLKPNGIIAIWCTNSASCLQSILSNIFPTWNVIFKAKWYWVKVTTAGDVVHDFNETHNKQPYEILVVGSLSPVTVIENEKIILSVPSAMHSHKPPLTEIFKLYLPKKPLCLEIFARYLIPGWHSLGLEVLKFQHLSLYHKEFHTNVVNIDNVNK